MNPPQLLIIIDLCIGHFALIEKLLVVILAAAAPTFIIFSNFVLAPPKSICNEPTPSLHFHGLNIQESRSPLSSPLHFRPLSLCRNWPEKKCGDFRQFPICLVRASQWWDHKQNPCQQPITNDHTLSEAAAEVRAQTPIICCFVRPSSKSHLDIYHIKESQFPGLGGPTHRRHTSP